MALENKLGITNSAELAREEERISKRKAVELFEKYGVFDYIREFYDVLHTTGYQYINHDIDLYLKARKAEVPG